MEDRKEVAMGVATALDEDMLARLTRSRMYLTSYEWPQFLGSSGLGRGL